MDRFLEKQERLISSFYQAAIDPALWADALSSLAAHFSAAGAVMAIWDSVESLPASIELTDSLLHLKQPYIDYYGLIDPFRAAVQKQPFRQWTTCSQFFDEDYVQSSLFFVDFIMANGLRYLAGVQFESSSHGQVPLLALVRKRDEGEFSDEDLSELQLLASPFQEAFFLYQKVRRTQFENQLTAGLMNQLSYGVIVADVSGRVVMTNLVADQILETSDGLTLKEGALRSARSFEQVKLFKALAAPSRLASAESGSFLVARPSGKLPYALLVTPLTPELRSMTGLARPLAMIVVTDFDLRSEVRVEKLESLFGFTPAEARVAVAMAQGKDLRQIATETERTLPTLRSHLRAMFEKTGVKRQVDIVRLVLSLPAVLK